MENGSNRNVSVSVRSLRPPLDTRRPVVIPKLVPVSGVWSTFAALLAKRSAFPPCGLSFPGRGIILGSSAQATKWLVRGCSFTNLWHGLCTRDGWG